MKLENKTIPWSDAYWAVATTLAKLKKVWKNEAGKVLYKAFNDNSAFVNTNKWFKKFDTLKVIDPLHIFASISANTHTEAKRTELIDHYHSIILGALPQSLLHFFRQGHEYSKIDFRGCPFPPAIQSLSLRDEDKQQQIWEAFESIYHHAQDCELDAIFEQSKSWYGVSHRLLTMFLFWVSPKNFLPLDRNTVDFLGKNIESFKEPKTAKNYKKLLKYRNSNVYRDIALISFKPELSNELIDKVVFERYFGKSGDEIDTKKHNFKLLAIKPLKGCNPHNLKSLKENVVYKLDSGFKLFDDNKIEYKEAYKLFSLPTMSINYSVIVGKNGTGKSTLVELFIACFNNIAFKLFPKGGGINVSFVKSINVEFYFYTDNLYRITLTDDSIDVVVFEQAKDSFFYAPRSVKADELEFRSLFYSVLVNYSLHGLNQKYYQGDWLNKLFHKNDGYQTPVVIEPFRKDGNIDINRQDELAKTRLIHNLLAPTGIDDSSRVLKRCKNKDYKAQSFKLCHNHEKLTDTPQEYRRSDFKPTDKSHLIKNSDVDVGMIISQLFDAFKCSENLAAVDEKGRNYLVRKLLSLTANYSTYFDFFNLEKGNYKFKDTKKFVNKIRKDTSHRVVKLRRAINYFKFGLYPSTSDEYSIFDVSKSIEGILAEAFIEKPKHTLEEERLEFLLPPSFFHIHIYLEDNTEFSSLSSGEKQIIYSLNAITYHLRNLDSVLQENATVKYNFVNIFLDEIELCFHPELQRLYLSELSKILLRFNNDSENILGINICFITHSPFVLSDIPDCNVLFLTHDDDDELLSVPHESTIQTFAANIHDLLNDGFFIRSTIGAFAEECIKEILNFNLKVKKADLSNIENKRKLAQEFKENKDRYSYIVSSLGDTYIKPLIESNLTEIVEVLELTEIKNDLKQEKIKALEKELEQLKSNVKD